MLEIRTKKTSVLIRAQSIQILSSVNSSGRFLPNRQLIMIITDKTRTRECQMRRTRPVAQLSIIMLCFGSSMALSASPSENDLISLEKRLAAAVLALDFESLDQIYSDSFIFTHSTGNVETKSDWLQSLSSGRSSHTERSVDKIAVELHDGVAVTQGRLHVKSNSSNPRWREYSIWYIRVYAWQDERWQLLSHRSIREETGPLSTD